MAIVPAGAFAQDRYDDYGRARYGRDYRDGGRYADHEYREHARHEARERDWRANEWREHEWREHRAYDRAAYRQGFYDRAGCWHAY